ncbi:phosphoribosylformylglycinamidine cyclo-ligase [Gammaproteobacteria bacterium]|nr:phosphoribosylformylglycinamidine cyclo-ligase [Gammaproteobacteria bacterium]
MTKEIIENDPYKSAGVDIDAGNNLVDLIKKDVASSHTQNVLGNIGGFAGMFKLDKEYENPVLVACTDGVGTKVALAQEADQLDGIGQDLVAMCVNDLIVCGAKPLFFLDYFASSKLEVSEAAKVIKSIANACKDSGCALLGGETAEMPGHYVGKNFDLAGFSVGCVEENKVIDNTNIKENDVLIGIESSGPHSNGFSLIRKIIKDSNLNKEEYRSMVELALKPTYLYPNLIMKLVSNFDIHGMAHITGGGLTENIPRSIPENLSASIDTGSWVMPEIFKWLQANGSLEDEDMFRIFNCGIGMVLIVKEDDSIEILEEIKNHNFKCFSIGKLINKHNNNSVVFK